MTDPDSAFRLNKAIAACGFCSRRKADELIFAGKVQVNGKVEMNPGARIGRNDRLEVNGRLLRFEKQKIHLMLNKPPQVICTVSDPEGRQTVIDILPEEYRGKRLFPVGRLDYFSEGLLLLTNDGGFAQRMAHPRYEKSKIYEATIRGKVEKNILKKMSSGMELEDGTKLLPIKIEERVLPNGDTLLRMRLRQGINRQIRRMCRMFNLVILRLRRIQEGGLSLGDLATGKCRALTPAEIDMLMADKRK